MGEVELPGTVNYFLGNDPAKWKRSVPTYERVRYRGVYPGIDLVYYGTESVVEHDFIVQPGADPATIITEVDGSTEMAMASNGDLILETEDGDFRQSRPVAYQTIDSQRILIPVSYRIMEGERYGFAVGAYDQSKPLIIDPVLSLSTFLGGSSGDYGNAVTVDELGNIYVFVQTYSADLPSTSGAYIGGAGKSDFVVWKVDPTGASRLFCTYLGGSDEDTPFDLAVGNDRSVYVTGGTFSTDYPTANPIQAQNAGLQDGVVTRLSSGGDSLIYSTYYGGSGGPTGEGEVGTNIAVDGAGNAFVTGWTRSGDFPSSPGAYQTVAQGGSHDIFVAKISPAGARLWGTILGGGDDDLATGLAIDDDGNTYISAHTQSRVFPPRLPSGTQTGISGSYDAVLLKLNAAGNDLLFYTYFGGSGTDTAYGRLARDAAGSIYIAGWTWSTDLPTTPGAFQELDPDGTAQKDTWVAKFDGSTGTRVYATYLGGAGADDARGLTVDPAGNAFVVGFTDSPNFPLYCPLQPAALMGPLDSFVTKLNASGSGLLFSSFLGGSGEDAADYVMTVDGSTVWVTGWTASGDFPTTSGAFDTSYGGSADAYLIAINLSDDVTAPTCRMTATRLGPPTQIDIRVQDTGSGLASIEATVAQNCTISGNTSFIPGTTVPVVVTATKVNQSQRARVELRVTDCAGNVWVCDPVVAEIEIPRGRSRVQRVFRNLPAHEHFISLTNETPGLRSAGVRVNGKRAGVTSMADGGAYTLDVAELMAKKRNTVTINAAGPPGSKALLIIGDASVVADDEERPLHGTGRWSANQEWGPR